MWELYKDCVWESEEFKCVSIQSDSRDWISQVTQDWRLAKMPDMWSMQETKESW